MNQIQVVGTHNSYHAGLAPSEAKLMMEQNPKLYQALEYRHPALDRQLDSGVRQIELDIFADSDGGRYAHPAGPDAVAAAGLPQDPVFDPEGLMSKPGFKVMHVQDIDYRSNCQQLIACLQIVRAWSKRHPRHVPIFILLETKQTDLPPKYHAVTTEKFTTATFASPGERARQGGIPHGPTAGRTHLSRWTSFASAPVDIYQRRTRSA